MKKIRILYAMGGIMRRAGAETVIMQYFRQIVTKPEFDISFLVHGDGVGDFDEEIESYGVSIFHVPVRGKEPVKYVKEINAFFKKNQFDIVHCNMDTACGDFLQVAKKYNIAVRIAHSHITDYQATNTVKKIFAYISKKKIPYVATDLFACSDMAGKWMYGKHSYSLVKNAINLDEFQIDNEKRTEVRDWLNVEDDVIVVGHIGRFMFQKNHEGLIKIFAAFHKKQEKSILVCIGTGEDEDRIRNLVDSMNLSSAVQFCGVRSDVSDIMQGFDVFVLPSLFEGLPVVGIEAQAAGLTCIFSENVTEEVCLLPSCKRIPHGDIEQWVRALEVASAHGKCNDAINILEKNGYCITLEGEKLAKIYKNRVNRV